MGLVQRYQGDIHVPLAEMGFARPDVGVHQFMIDYVNWAAKRGVSVSLAQHTDCFYIDERSYTTLRDDWTKFKEKKMATPTTPAATPEKPHALLAPIKLGAQLALANEAGELTLEAIASLFPQLQPFLKDDLGRSLGKAAGATLLTYLAEATDIPEKENIARVCGLVLTASTQEVASDKLAALRPILLKIAALGKTIPAVAASTTG